MYVGFGNVLGAGLNFLFLTAAAKTLDIENFGRYALVTSVLIGLARISDFGTNSLYVVGKKMVTQYFSAKAILTLAGTILSIVVLLLMNITNGHLIVLFVVGFLGYSINYTLFGLFQRVENYTALIFLLLIPSLIKGTYALAIFLNIVQLDFLQYFGVFTLSILPTGVLAFWTPIKLRFDIKEGIFLLKKACSPGIGQLIQENLPAINNTLAKSSQNFSGVGIFSLANKITMVFVVASFSIFTVLLPKNAKRIKANEGYDLRETLILSMGIFILGITTIVVGKLFIVGIFGDKFIESLRLLNILVFAGTFTSITSFMENYFFVKNKSQYILRIHLTKLSILLILAAVLMPRYELLGLAWAQLIAAVIALGAVYLFFNKASSSSSSDL